VRPALWISIKPKFAEAILGYTKEFELRRVAPQVVPGSIAVIYASAPTMAIVGAFTIEGVLTDTLEDLWDTVGGSCLLDRPAYDNYFEGKVRGVALIIGKRWKAREMYSLQRLRMVWKGFIPPQSYRYLSVEPGPSEVNLPLIGGPTLQVLPRTSANNLAASTLQI